MRKKSITVSTNDPEQPAVKLKVAADVHVALALEPSQINLRNLKKGTEITKYVSLTGSDKDTTQITAVENKNEGIKVETNPAGYNNNKDKRIKITLAPEIKIGRFRDKITVQTDHKTIKKISAAKGLQTPNESSVMSTSVVVL